jgi:hypothetical protein
MRGLERFVEARMRGRLLSRTVLLWIGMDGDRWWAQHPENFVFAEGRVDSPRDDMRAVVGLDVILVCGAYDDRAAAIYTQLKTYARSIVFAMLQADDGLYWAKGHGDRLL